MLVQKVLRNMAKDMARLEAAPPMAVSGHKVARKRDRGAPAGRVALPRDRAVGMVAGQGCCQAKTLRFLVGCFLWQGPTSGRAVRKNDP